MRLQQYSTIARTFALAVLAVCVVFPGLFAHGVLSASAGSQTFLDCVRSTQHGHSILLEWGEIACEEEEEEEEDSTCLSTTARCLDRRVTADHGCDRTLDLLAVAIYSLLPRPPPGLIADLPLLFCI
jgi:hypothetical protein